jgi:L-iditol 2-dehydrogenase
MKLARILEPGRITLEEVPKPQPGPSEALIAVEYCGVCGSDVHAYNDRHPFVKRPVAPGHEFAGVVAEIGDDVSGLDLGTPVTVEPQIVCGQCQRCLEGRYNICMDLKVIGCQIDGAMGEFVAVPADRVLPLPPAVDTRLGTMVEPLAVGIHAIEQGGGVRDKNIMVLGAGAIGLSILMAASALGAASITVADPISARLDLAGKLGAAYLTQPEELDIIAWSREITKGQGFDLVFECVGADRALESSIRTVRKGGTAVLVGVYGDTVSASVGLVQDREISMVGSLMYLRSDYLQAIQLIADGKAPVGELISHEFPLADVVEAFRLIEDPKTSSLKVIININSD